MWQPMYDAISKTVEMCEWHLQTIRGAETRLVAAWQVRNLPELVMRRNRNEDLDLMSWLALEAIRQCRVLNKKSWGRGASC